MAIGTEGGLVKVYDASAYLTSYTVINTNKERQKEGHILKVLHQYNFLIWASKKYIYVKHYTLHGAVNEALIQIARPDLDDT